MDHVIFAPRRLLAGMATLLLLTGCASSLNRPYESPASQLPAQYSYDSSSAAKESPASSDAWWKNFNDPELDRLIAQALLRNNNLAAATLRVRRAQLQAGLADQQLRPQFSGNANVGASRRLESNTASTRSNSVNLGASYELDLWNKLGSQRDLARWEALATAQDRESTALTLVATTAQLYWRLGFLNQRLASNALSIAYARTTFDLVQTQYRAGAVSGLEVAEARQALASQQASQAQLQQQAVEAVTALALLFDTAPGNFRADSSMPPGELPAGSTPLSSAVWRLPQSLPDTTLPGVDAGLPVQLLGRRPDLRAAELRVRESFTRIDATRASYYPALTLTGSLGSSSTALLQVLQNPVASLGLGLSLPFLQRTQMKLNIQVSEAQYDEAVVNFRQTLYSALGDVDNALSGRQQFARQAELLAESLAAARQAERLYEVRYRAGAAPLKAWLDAQEKRRSAEIAVADNRLSRLNNHVGLYQALGGDAVPLPGAAR